MTTEHTHSTAQIVYNVIHQTLDIPLESISSQMKIEDLTEDSIQLFQLILAFEDAFGIQAVYEDLINIVTVQDIITYLDTTLSSEKQ